MGRLSLSLFKINDSQCFLARKKVVKTMWKELDCYFPLNFHDQSLFILKLMPNYYFLKSSIDLLLARKVRQSCDWLCPQCSAVTYVFSPISKQKNWKMTYFWKASIILFKFSGPVLPVRCTNDALSMKHQGWFAYCFRRNFLIFLTYFRVPKKRQIYVF